MACLQAPRWYPRRLVGGKNGNERLEKVEAGRSGQKLRGERKASAQQKKRWFGCRPLLGGLRASKWRNWPAVCCVPVVLERAAVTGHARRQAGNKRDGHTRRWEKRRRERTEKEKRRKPRERRGRGRAPGAIAKAGSEVAFERQQVASQSHAPTVGGGGSGQDSSAGAWLEVKSGELWASSLPNQFSESDTSPDGCLGGAARDVTVGPVSEPWTKASTTLPSFQGCAGSLPFLPRLQQMAPPLFTVALSAGVIRVPRCRVPQQIMGPNHGTAKSR